MKIEAKQRDFSEVDFTEVHDIIFPADVREGDLITARVKKRGGEDYYVYRVWKLSPLGVELLPSEELLFEKGERIDLELTVGRQVSHFEGIVVDEASGSRQRPVVGVRFSAKVTELVPGVDRRRGSRWLCSSQFDPVCIAPNPAQFNDFLYLKIRDISGSGIRAITSLRNKFVVPGMELNLQISFPLTSHISTTMRVSRLGVTTEAGKDYLELGLIFTSLSRQQREIIGQYLVQFSDAESLADIRQEGFFPLSLTKGVDYQYIKSAEDFKSVLELRLRANRENGKVPDHYTAADMADVYDTRGRILVGKYKGTIVGTARLTFTEPGERLEHEEYLTLPDDFPRREQILECSRAATNPDFRGSDLWTTLIQHLAICAIQARRHWCVISTTPELVDMYRRLGFKATGMTYEHELYPGKTQVVMLINVPEAVMGIGVGPIYWNVVWRDVAKYLADQELLGPSTRVKIYSVLSPFAEIAKYFSRRPRRKTRTRKG
ncbi:MAG: GNAT family N-acetyltransferase [Gammaproteobacteria bacterium]|jgi:predicted GNAT family N-acyltransferase|nr:GNAT family N-acetyltransferase [Gammaproteobacteria bacterium]